MLNRHVVFVKSVVLIAGVFLIGMLLFSQTEKPSAQLNPVTVKTRASAVRPLSVSPSNVSLRRTAKIDFRKAFAESHNYWDYAHQIHPAAQAGDADAQFYLSKVMEYCQENNDKYFRHKGSAIGLDEAVQLAAKRRYPIEVVQSVYDRCHDFQDRDLTELGNSTDWLAKATGSGQPLAQALTASKLIEQDAQRNFARAAGVPNPNAAPIIVSTTSPRELLRAAVESKDPEVFFRIADAQNILQPESGDPDINRYAWWLIACDRGFDCSANAEWVKLMCVGDSQCASFQSSSDLVRTLSGGKWPEVQQRAKEISSDLDAGRWNDLGLGS